MRSAPAAAARHGGELHRRPDRRAAHRDPRLLRRRRARLRHLLQRGQAREPRRPRGPDRDARRRQRGRRPRHGRGRAQRIRTPTSPSPSPASPAPAAAASQARRPRASGRRPRRRPDAAPGVPLRRHRPRPGPRQVRRGGPVSPAPRARRREQIPTRSPASCEAGPRTARRRRADPVKRPYPTQSRMAQVVRRVVAERVDPTQYARRARCPRRRAVDRPRPLLEGLRVAAKDAVEQAAHQHLQRERLELVGDMELHVAAARQRRRSSSGSPRWRNGPLGYSGTLPASTCSVEGSSTTRLVKLSRKRVIADRHLADQDRLVVLALALLDGQAPRTAAGTRGSAPRRRRDRTSGAR